VRPGAAWPPAERPSDRLPVQQAVPHASRWPHCRASWLPSAACAAHSNAVRRPSDVVVPRCPMPTVPCSPCPRHLSASVCPASTRPASGVCPVSAGRVSNARVQSPVSDIGCPVSGVQCQRPVSVRIASVSALSAPVSSWNARVRPAATRLGTGRVGVSPYPSAGQPVRGGSLTAAGCVRVGRSVLPAARCGLSPWVVGRPRWEVLGRQRERAPPRPKAAGGPQQQSGREAKPGLASENCGGPAGT
jgi:hypothetical protein